MVIGCVEAEMRLFDHSAIRFAIAIRVAWIVAA